MVELKAPKMRSTPYEDNPTARHNTERPSPGPICTVGEYGLASPEPPSDQTPPAAPPTNDSGSDHGSDSGSDTGSDRGSDRGSDSDSGSDESTDLRGVSRDELERRLNSHVGG